MLIEIAVGWHAIETLFRWAGEYLWLRPGLLTVPVVALLKTETKSRFLNRNRLDIMQCILENSSGSRKTRLIYRCNLSLSQFNIFKDCLVEAGLLKVSKLKNGVEIFETTEKGKEFLSDYKHLRSILETSSSSPATPVLAK